MVETPNYENCLKPEKLYSLHTVQKSTIEIVKISKNHKIYKFE